MQCELDDRQRALIADMLGSGARIRATYPAASFRAPVFVADLDRRPEHYRILGSFGPDAITLELSAMDLIYPARLVSHHEQLMSLAFGLCGRPATALLLGTGGAAMWRFTRAHLPDCAATLVDSDATIVAVARRWFYLTEPVEIEDGEHFLARTTRHFDAILVDLNDAEGPARLDPAFWSRCLDTLMPGGCLAANWVDFGRARPMAEAMAAAGHHRDRECFFVKKGIRGNVVQYLPTAEGKGPESVPAALHTFAAERHLPADMRGLLDECAITRDFPELA